ncbi:DHCW motif cupin fold protein [Falsiroseomonas stagni]|jgi:hypothetical protein|uniref:DHCW motif cupin fold protein n=1 Tax=Falsiroseomonas stagni DSM 19981 TaxID=1123062 RepID=A0A1I4B2Z2_9PROT|nr:DHCW motif cupin fold protein [Falsiroseomonas stagni]MBX9595003.1 DHCW motif cupin fold protein [Roseomonas sp.]SFK62547.1 hypothetical protein SAMN02745775_104367 [Falsiroseomonas stagni DSM 19981]
MIIEGVPFQTVDWSAWPETHHKGETGHATWRTLEVGNIRVRMVEYSPGYKADHWCSRGHVLLVMKGQLTTELADGRVFVMKEGVSYQVAENAEPHRSQTETGATLFIVD